MEHRVHRRVSCLQPSGVKVTATVTFIGVELTDNEGVAAYGRGDADWFLTLVYTNEKLVGRRK